MINDGEDGRLNLRLRRHHLYSYNSLDGISWCLEAGVMGGIFSKLSCERAPLLRRTQIGMEQKETIGLQNALTVALEP